MEGERGAWAIIVSSTSTQRLDRYFAHKKQEFCSLFDIGRLRSVQLNRTLQLRVRNVSWQSDGEVLPVAALTMHQRSTSLFSVKFYIQNPELLPPQSI
jgi:hypothetical protein